MFKGFRDFLLRGNVVDLAVAVVCDNEDNVYFSGASMFGADVATTGAYQIDNAGDFDAFVVKFNSNGQRIWGTYFGGASVDYGYGLTCDEAGNVYLAGPTSSDAGIATAGSYQPAKNSRFGTDAFIAKFDSSGHLRWATYYGGTEDEDVVALKADKNGHFYLAGYTSSLANIATANTTQPQYGGGNDDAFVVQFDTAGVPQWGTYYGGSDEDWAEGLDVDASGNVYLGGYTKSTSGIATANSYQASLAGGKDKFLVKLSNTGQRIWGTYYGGDKDENNGSFHTVACDAYSNVYLSGHTVSKTGIATPNSHQPALSDSLEAFVVKFDSAGRRNWATYYGGINDDYGANITCDNAGNLIMVGMTKSTAGIATPGAYQPANAGRGDAFMVKFDSSGKRLGGTYYGGLRYEEIQGVTCDKTGSIYICGATESGSGIATSNGFLSTYNGGLPAFLAKFCSIGLPVAMPIAGEDSICGYKSERYSIAEVDGAIYIWTLPDGWTGSSDSSSIDVVAGSNAGVISVQVVKCDDTSVAISMTVEAREIEAVITIDGFNLSTTMPYKTYQWLVDGTPISGATGNTYNVTENGNYRVVVTNEFGCVDTSDVYAVTNVGIGNVNNIAGRINVYPNPASDVIHIIAQEEVNVMISGMDGKAIRIEKNVSAIAIGDLTPGVSLLTITNKYGTAIKTVKLVKANR